MFASLLTYLDKFSEKDKLIIKNADLSQGKEFGKYERALCANTFERLPYLQVTTMPGLLSVNEAFNGDDSIIAKNKHINDNLSKHEAEFNKTLSEYSTMQNNLLSSGLHHNVDKKSNDIIMNKLDVLNKQLIMQAKNINADMSNINVSDVKMKNYIKEKQTYLKYYIQSLEEQKTHMKNIDMDTVNGMQENTKLIRNSNHYYYLTWFIVLFTMLALFLYTLTSDLIMNTLVVMICLIIIYILARLIH